MVTKDSVSKILSLNKPDKRFLNEKLLDVMIYSTLLNLLLTAFVLMILKTYNPILVQADKDPFLMTIIFSVIIAPIIEEVVMRGIIYSGFMQLPIVYNAIINGLLFGIIHRNMTQFVGAFVTGFVFSYIIYVTKSIFYTIGFHMLMNFIASIGGTFRSKTNMINIVYHLNVFILIPVILLILMSGIFTIRALNKFLIEKEV
jgi:membrane protease YdiL (CAAX protease family)